MPIQNIPLDYGWMISLVRAISQAREAQQALGLEERRVGLEGERVGMERERMETSQAMSGQVPYGQAISSQARPSQGTQVSRGTTGVSTPSQGVSGSASLAGWVESKTAPGAAAEGRRREERLLDEARKHEILLKQMDVDAKLADAMSKERIAGVEAEAGTEQTKIAGASNVAASQKTTMEKGYEFLAMLWDMDEESADELITSLLAKEAEQTGSPVSTITMGGVTETLPEATPEADPNNPLTWMREVGFDPETGAPRPKPTGAAAKPEIDQYLELIDDLLDKNPQSIVAITTGKGWEELKETMRTIGAEAGFSEDVINSGIGMYQALVPEYEEPAEEGEGLGGAIRGALTPFGVGSEELPPEAIPGAEAYLEGAGAFKEGAAKVEKAPGFAKTLEEFIETIITGPFHPGYVKRKGEKADKVKKEEEAKGITEQNFESQIIGWSKEQRDELKAAAKAEKLSVWEYYNKHREEFKNE